MDAMRIKGNALLMAGQAVEAIDFYQQVLTMRPLPWAKLGLARALQKKGDATLSVAALSELIAESPRLMAAYDLLGKLHLELGNADAALATLDSARTISPNSLARHRAIASVAEVQGDFQRVEQALDQVVKKTRNSPLRETEDIARLGNALTEMGEPAKAVTLLEEARKNFKEDANNPLMAAVEAIAHQKAGNPEKAEAALERAMNGDLAKLPPAVAMTVAKACLSAGKQTAAQEIMKNLVQSNPESTGLHAQISTVLRDSGAGEVAETLVAESIREMIQLNNEACARGRTGACAECYEAPAPACNIKWYPMPQPLCCSISGKMGLIQPSWAKPKCFSKRLWCRRQGIPSWRRSMSCLAVSAANTHRYKNNAVC